jgi:hypothetical protein
MTKTTINITNKNKTSLTFQDISSIVDQLNKDMANPKYSSKFVIIASTPFAENFTIKGYNETNIKHGCIEDYLNGRVKNTTKFSQISQISIMMIKERI